MFDLIIVKNDINKLMKSFKIDNHKVVNIYVKNNPEKYIQLNKTKEIITYNLKKNDIVNIVNNLNLESLENIEPLSINCPITLDKIKYPIKVNCCNNYYSLVSILKCYQKDKHCPLCRSKINLSNIKLNFNVKLKDKLTNNKIKLDEGLFICQNTETDFYVLKQLLDELSNYSIKIDNY